MEMSEIYNGKWVHDIFLVNKAEATEYITGRSSTLFIQFHSRALNDIYLKASVGITLSAMYTAVYTNHLVS